MQWRYCVCCTDRVYANSYTWRIFKIELKPIKLIRIFVSCMSVPAIWCRRSMLASGKGTLDTNIFPRFTFILLKPKLSCVLQKKNQLINRFYRQRDHLLFHQWWVKRVRSNFIFINCGFSFFLFATQRVRTWTTLITNNYHQRRSCVLLMEVSLFYFVFQWFSRWFFNIFYPFIVCRY